MPSTPLIYTIPLGNFCFVDSFQSALQNDYEMLSGQDYFYTNKSLKETFRIDLQEVFGDFCEDFVLCEMHNGLDMLL